MTRLSNLGSAIVILTAVFICSVALFCLVETNIVGIAGYRAQDSLEQASTNSLGKGWTLVNPDVSQMMYVPVPGQPDTFVPVKNFYSKPTPPVIVREQVRAPQPPQPAVAPAVQRELRALRRKIARLERRISHPRVTITSPTPPAVAPAVAAQ
eukprot:CAMPEP_0172154544 /NCGR_PEP_ID=MMETSP1050-20130122/2096_1 /TAXON_ID=233186 /ORGANISM="Cryptomonas curvata, Strain CCAP979/52" /LENGTH=152 /DNA_ID=CAMNT_0012823277 /DNA_START=92 /DNA_END=547 /DNA_ORIENTATION=-